MKTSVFFARKSSKKPINKGKVNDLGGEMRGGNIEMAGKYTEMVGSE